MSFTAQTINFAIVSGMFEGPEQEEKTICRKLRRNVKEKLSSWGESYKRKFCFHIKEP